MGTEDVKRSKRPAVIFLICIAAMLLLVIALSIVNGAIYGNVDAELPNTIPDDVKYALEKPDWTEDIMQDSNYLNKDRYFYYCNEFGGGWQVTVDIDALDSYPAPVAFLVDFVNILIEGDSVAYNDMFSDSYHEKYGYAEDFTMQKIYNIIISRYSEQTVVEKGHTYTKYIYTLDYKIMENDGTYRMDIGSDMTRTQYITITDREGDLKIDLIQMFFQ